MYVIENLKKAVKHAVGTGKLSPATVQNAVRQRKPQTSLFKDDGAVPNNSQLPLIHYRGAVRLTNCQDPAAVFEELFELNGWKGTWRNGIYDYAHYHSRTHEVLGVARGQARVRFGGDKGKVIEVHAGDVIVLPVGTGHQRISASKDLLVVGAYPTPNNYDECKGTVPDREHALKTIPKVLLPAKDPVYGANGPIIELWKR